MDLFSYLRWLFRQGAGFELAYPRLARLGYRAAYGKSPLPGALLEEARSATLAYFQNLGDEGVRNGNLDRRIDTHLAAFVFYAVFNELGRYLVMRAGTQPETLPESGHYPLDAPEMQVVFDQLIEIQKNGMAVKNETGRSNHK